jgi:hypothetical protein
MENIDVKSAISAYVLDCSLKYNKIPVCCFRFLIKILITVSYRRALLKDFESAFETHKVSAMAEVRLELVCQTERNLKHLKIH